ncbi:hypothetical protein B0H14DRAFT_2605924 [Mycena olivaceomarginata]|nr:hypothetical protein B0H14DRAFT_2605924 [Mycena olivaceomarginata]
MSHASTKRQRSSSAELLTIDKRKKRNSQISNLVHTQDMGQQDQHQHHQSGQQVAVVKRSSEFTNLHKLSLVGHLHCAKDAGTAALKACLPDTRVRLLSCIRAWALHPTSERMLLLHGAAGKGKSAIAHTVARELQSDGRAVVPFFAFNRLVPDRSASQLIPTWARHLAESNEHYLLYLQGLSSHQLESSDLLEQRDALFIGGLASGIDDGKPLIFIIDGLDECPKGETTHLFRVLRELLSGPHIPTFIRFLFTYRSDEEILRTFEGLPALNIPIDNEEGTAEDIHKFVHAQLCHNPHVADMVDDVAKAAQTLFECAAALCRELTAARRPVSTSARNGFIRRLREGPVMSLYESYHAILEMYFGQGDKELMQLFRRLMTWIFLVRTPQPRRVFRVFAAVLLSKEERSDVESILSWLGSLLSGTTSEDDPVSPLHTSLRDFLLDADKSRIFSLDLGLHSQVELSQACLKIMNSSLRFNICRLPTSFALNSDVKDLPKKVKKYISPERHYACLATGHHLRGTLPLSPRTNQFEGSPISGAINPVHPVKSFLKNMVGFLLTSSGSLQISWME